MIIHSSSKTIFLLPIFLIFLSSCSIWDSCAKYSGSYGEDISELLTCEQHEGCMAKQKKYHDGIPGTLDTDRWEFTCTKKK